MEYRYEYKAAIETIDPELAEQYVLSHPYNFSRLYPDRFINSIYFDNAEYRTLEDNIEGLSERYKIRLRWYSYIEHLENAFLEYKIKSATTNTKIRLPTSPFSLNLHHCSSWDSLLASLSSHLPHKDSLILENHRFPILICRYLRSYFMSENEEVRLTIDRNLTYFDQLSTLRPNIEEKVQLPYRTILEFKFENKSKNIRSDVFQHFPVTVTRSSKYKDGVNILNYLSGSS